MACIPKDEIKRKSFHLLSLLYVFGYWYLPKNIVVLCLAVAMTIVILLEYIRFKFPKINDFFKNNFKGFYRSEEAEKISGVIWTLSGAFIAIVLFPNKSMVFASLLYFVFGDAAAALVGRTIGRHKIFTNKSLEGSSACFTVCFIIGLFLFNIQFALIGAISATLIEAIPWKLNDNFWMQIINAGVLTVFSSVIIWTK
ncbi:MAG: hypothetical protein LBJ98_01420 [Endomicrobium sp.]|jgi:dolichol kinase|nr:hypothetical protein [Endomicrobium sp.]MDR2644995.1 hypothetical protein [Endomicrobium sp.]